MNILATLFSQDSRSINEVVSVLPIYDNIYKVPIHLDSFKEAIHQVAEYIGAREVRFWELLKKGYKKPKLKKLDYFRFYTNIPIVSVEFDYCCHPKVGDQIVAFYKDSRVIIHHKLCKKAYGNIVLGESMLFVGWSCEKLSRYRLTISLQNQKGILAKLLASLSELNLNVVSIQLGIKSSDKAEYCQIEVESNEAKKTNLSDRISQKYKLIEIISLDDAYNK